MNRSKFPFGCGGWIWTTGLQVMGLTSYQAALPRDNLRLDYDNHSQREAQVIVEKS